MNGNVEKAILYPEKLEIQEICVFSWELMS